ncbi:MAG: 4-hydroxy-tetrahydrodipicolinate reductase [Dysgonamonadaceae bacterium]|jgi:4-hydroxy-tetrahydrodipicolinate reductase|nr:4-hydroxy-tetrahydrodipicolinate reductase [Dysgonamonadaceae bacterium]
MKIAIIGYGKMGREIEKAAVGRGHKIVSIIDENNLGDFDSEAFLSAEAAIEFTRPTSAVDNYKRCFDRNIPVVSGTTGWLSRYGDVCKYCQQESKTFFYASNFSIGVNILFAMNKYLAGIMNRFPDYDASIEEVHHIHKLDSPSGTAITLAEDIIDRLDRKQQWKDSDAGAAGNLLIHSRREGEVPGIHEVIYRSAADEISIRHNAFNRSGFAVGAVIAAEFIRGKKGCFTMKDMLNF